MHEFYECMDLSIQLGTHPLTLLSACVPGREKDRERERERGREMCRSGARTSGSVTFLCRPMETEGRVTPPLCWRHQVDGVALTCQDAALHTHTHTHAAWQCNEKVRIRIRMSTLFTVFRAKTAAFWFIFFYFLFFIFYFLFFFRNGKYDQISKGISTTSQYEKM